MLMRIMHGHAQNWFGNKIDLFMKIKLISPNTWTNDVVMNVLLHDRLDGALNISSNEIISESKFYIRKWEEIIYDKRFFIKWKIGIIVMLYH